MTNSVSMSTALLIMSTMRDLGRQVTHFKYRRHAKSQWRASLRLISSLLKHNPGIRPRFLSQKIAQKDPKKKMPLTAANAIMRSVKLAVAVLHHLRAHCALHRMHGTVSIARSRWVFFDGSLMYMSMRNKYVVLWIFLTAIWKPYKHLASGDVISVAKLPLRFLLTMPSEAAKNARTWDMKCCSDGESLSQSVMSLERSISLAVQKDALAFLYILQLSGFLMGKSMKHWGFGRSNGSGACRPSISVILWCDALHCNGRGGSGFLTERE